MEAVALDSSDVVCAVREPPTARTPFSCRSHLLSLI